MTTALQLFISLAAISIIGIAEAGLFDHIHHPKTVPPTTTTTCAPEVPTTEVPTLPPITTTTCAPEVTTTEAPKCTKKCTGGIHDKCTLCGSACAETCDSPPDRVCTLQCLVNVCQCENGYVRGPDGQCIKKDECPPKCTKKCIGGPHDKCTMCGSACPLTCKKPEPGVCTKQCVVNVCECVKGYVRAKNGKCIKPTQCHPEDCADD